MRRAQWTALGLSDEDMDKPKIAIVNSSSSLASCFSHLDGDRAAAEGGDPGRRAAWPFEVRTAAPSDFDHQRRAGRAVHPAQPRPHRQRHRGRRRGRPARRHGHLASCDKTDPRPAHGRRAAGHPDDRGRLRLPALAAIYRGEHVDFEDVFLYAGHVAGGRDDRRGARARWPSARSAVPACAPGMGTANSMHIAAEALGHVAARHDAGAGQQPGDVGRRRPGRRADRASWWPRGCARVRSSPRARSATRSPPSWRSAARSTASSTCRRSRVEAGCRRRRPRLFEELRRRVPLLYRRQAQRRHGGSTSSRPPAAPGRCCTSSAAARPRRSRTVAGGTLGEVIARRHRDRRRCHPPGRPPVRHPSGIIDRPRVAGPRAARGQADRRRRRRASVRADRRKVLPLPR